MEKKEKKERKKRVINKLKGVSIDEYEYVEPVKRKERAGFYLGYSSRLIISVILFVFTLSLSLFCLNNSVKIFEKEKITYHEKTNLDYKVKVKDNDYYESEFLEKNMSYVASLIDSVVVDFNYNFSSDKYLKGSYTYKIVADLDIINSDTNELFFTKRFEILPEEIMYLDEDKDFSVNRLINVDYCFYNGLANGFKATYGVNSSSKLNVKLIVTRDIDESVINTNQLDGVNEISLSIPLSEKAISIKLDYSDINSTNSVVSSDGLKSWDSKFLIIGLLLLLVTILDFVYMVQKLSKLQDKQSSYDRILRKILREYDRLIVNSATMPELDKYEVIKLNSFDELVDAKENLHKPIYYYDVVSHHKCHFFIKNDNEIIIYTLKDADLD